MVETLVIVPGRSSSGHLLDKAAARSGHCLDTSLGIPTRDGSEVKVPWKEGRSGAIMLTCKKLLANASNL